MLLFIALAGILITAACIALFTPLLSTLFHPSPPMPGSASPATVQNTAIFGQDAWHSRVDSTEQRLAYANVSHLVSDWTSSPVVAGGIVYVGSFDGMLYAFNAAGCKGADCLPLWASRPAGQGTIVVSAPAVASGTLYIGTYNYFTGAGEVAAYAAQGCGKLDCTPLWTYTPPGQDLGYYASPSVVNGVV